MERLPTFPRPTADSWKVARLTVHWQPERAYLSVKNVLHRRDVAWEGKPLKVRQNASNRMPPLRPAAPVLMRLRPWRTFESKDPYIAGRCGGGTTARAGPKWAFFLHSKQYQSSGREKAASWAACAVAGARWRGGTVAAPPCPLSRRGGHPGRPARIIAACSLS